MSAQRILKIAAGPGDDAVAAWLRVLEPLLKLPEPERRAIVDELENHLRERVRDQMLAGATESDAVRAAVAELGDAAALARRFREAGRTPLRRLAMNLAVLGVAGAAMVTSIVAVSGGGATRAPGVAVYQGQSQAPGATPKQPVLKDVEITNIALERALQTIAEMSGLKLIVRWERLQNEQIEREHPVTVIAHEADLDRVFQMLNEEVGNTPVDYRVAGKVLEVAPRSFFDHRDTELVSFDVSEIVAGGVKPDELVGAISQMVEQEHWVENGGSTGSMTVVGNRLFVKAPPRMWKKAGWMLDQLALEAGKPEMRDAAPLVQDIPLIGSLRQQKDSARIGAMRSLEERIKTARSMVAWQKASLGLELAPEERSWLLGNAAVKVIGPDDPERGAAEVVLRQYQEALESLLKEQADLRVQGRR
jgi:hypothetical protein